MRRFSMKITDVKKILTNCTDDEKDARQIVDLLKNRQADTHLCDLDLALILISLAPTSIDDKCVDAIFDSEFAKYFAPTSLADNVDYSNETKNSIIKTEIKGNILKGQIPSEVLSTIDEHELIGDVNIDVLVTYLDSFKKLRNSITMEARASEFYSFPLSQTGHKIIFDITLVNNSEENIKSLVLKISSNPNFFEVSNVSIPLLQPNQPISISEFGVNVKVDELLKLNEKIVGNITFSLYDGENEICSTTSNIEYYSYDTWIENLIPGSTAMFVTPNDEEVKNIVRLTAKTLERETGRSSLEDYQSQDKNIITAQVKALYDTLHDYGIGYITEPASYEKAGQKIRIPHEVLKGKQGTCIDLAILFASCLEAMGLNAGIVLISGHAYASVFLEDEHLPSSPYLDATRAIDLCDNEKELLFVECTMFAAGRDSSFEVAVAQGRELTHLHVADTNFEIIDITISRSNGYLPLPISFDDSEKICVDLQVIEENSQRLQKKELNVTDDKINLTNAELNKFDLWEKKLLDLSKRNELIDFKVDRNGQQILTFEADNLLGIDYLYDSFKGKGNQFSLVTSDITGPSGTLVVPDLTEDQFRVYSDAVKNKKLTCIKRKIPLSTALKTFYRERKKAFEESGSNILYLAIGFVEWFETDRSSKAKYAPIILVPIDLKRHSKDNYTIVGRDDPAFLNISIFEFFHQEFKMNFDDLLAMDLFSDDSKYTANAILNTVAAKIRNLTRARVIKTAAINLFKFSKAVMWQDVKYHRNELASNKVIKSILEKSYIVTDEEKLTEDFDDDASNPMDLAIPLSADSSQIKAIKDCAEGKSFILQGPPGTGKSQTITNMIVNAIYHGKTVLFVAEKMAALEVVQKRLEKLSLDRFALEAHSIKSDKSTVMEQFKKRIELNATISDTAKFEKNSTDLKNRRCELNNIINTLHKKNEYFISFYDALVRSEDMDDLPILPLTDEYVQGLDESKFNEHLKMVTNLENQIIENGGYVTNPFILYRNKKYIPNVTKSNFKECTAEYRKKLNLFLEAFNKFQSENVLHFDESRKIVKGVYDLLQDDEVKGVNVKLLNPQLLKDSELERITSKGFAIKGSIENLKDKFASSIFDIDVEKARFEYDKAKNSGFFSKGKMKKACVNQIASLAKSPKDIEFENLPNIYDELDNIKFEIKNLKEQMSKYEIIFGPISTIKVDEYDFASFKARLDTTKKIYEKYSELGLDLLVAIITKINSYSLKYQSEYIELYKSLMDTEFILERDFLFDYSLCEKHNFDYHNILEMSLLWESKLDYLRNWCYLMSIYDSLKEAGLDFVLDYIEKDEYDYLKNQLAKVYQKSIYSFIMKKTIMNEKGVSFNAVELKDCTEAYKKLINEFAVDTVKETAARITAKTPIMNEKSASSSEIGILRSAISNKCRGKSLRQLFSEIPNILTKYFPVFLMSPISCAQFLDHSMPKFDVIIFDEASQIPTSEAIGAIARGKNLIVVGDSMQMPPTSFFQSKGSDEEYVDLDDQESILDDCDVVGMPSRRLNWHYRSKHESLIRFSNVRFYNNSLVTFPSPNDLTSKVTLKNVRGVYDRKGKNNNAIEASAVIAEIERRLKSPELSKQSIGVVTFSAAQQEMIEDKLDELFAKNKELEAAYLDRISDTEHPLEPIIIKNLENIQGDERDVILFSVCYGPDKDGQMYFQFGPINLAGGEKRLNVAFSRARYEMMIFTSFDPTLLSQMNSSARGAQELYSFLRYAKNGSNALAIDNNTQIEMPVGIEKQIAKKLEKLGYKAVVDVGKSSFRVDIGIVDPTDDGKYILGVICDSYSYENASTSRDRNIIQPTTLKMLGWNIMRIWSFDYLDDPELVINTIVKEIKELEANPNRLEKKEDLNTNIQIQYESKALESLSLARDYIPFARKFKVTDDHKSTEFYNSIFYIVQEIMKVEVPISLESLYSKVATASSCTRATPDVQAAVNDALKRIDAKITKTGEKIFLWNNDGNTKLDYYRVSDVDQRSMDDISKEEIIVAIKEVLTNHGPMFVNELKSLVATCFGIKSVRNKVSDTLDATIEYYCNNKDDKKNLLMITGDTSRISLKEQNS